VTSPLQRPESHLAYSLDGVGPLVVLSTGMGDLRAALPDVVGPLAAAGHRVATVDLRGHGGSDTAFRDRGIRTTADDLATLVEHLGGPAALVGQSMSAASTAIVAAERPELVSGLAMLDPYLRVEPIGLGARLMTRTIRRPFGAALSASYHASLHKGRRAPWLDEHVAAVRAAMLDAGHYPHSQRPDVVVALQPATGAFARAELVHAVRAVRSALHGFVPLEMQGGFRMSEDVDVSYARLVALLEAGLVHTSPWATADPARLGALHDHAPSA